MLRLLVTITITNDFAYYPKIADVLTFNVVAHNSTMHTSSTCALTPLNIPYTCAYTSPNTLILTMSTYVHPHSTFINTHTGIPTYTTYPQTRVLVSTHKIPCDPHHHIPPTHGFNYPSTLLTAKLKLTKQ